MTDAQDDLETCKVDLAAARGDDHDGNARIAALEDKLSRCKSEKGASQMNSWESRWSSRTPDR